MNDSYVSEEIIRQIQSVRSVAPREIAEALVGDGEDWRKLLPRIKAVAITLEAEGKLFFIRKKKIVASSALKGVYRLASPHQWQ